MDFVWLGRSTHDAVAREMYRQFSGDNEGSEGTDFLSDKSEAREYIVPKRHLTAGDTRRGSYAAGWPPRLAILLKGADSAALACEVRLGYRCTRCAMAGVLEACMRPAL
jgi:hypothetical protein